nr:Tn3 family transposase [Pigmentibacter ruber]
MEIDDEYKEESEHHSNRLTILKPDEIKLIYERPLFSDEEREIYFDLSHKENIALNKLRILNSKINFILQLGYFKFKYRFFSFKLNEVEEDIKFIVEKHFKNSILSIKKIQDVSKITSTENKKTILDIFKYKYFDKKDLEILEEKALNLVKISAKQKYIFRELFNFLDENKIIIPRYSYMQDFISKILLSEESRLINIIEENIDIGFSNELNKLIQLKQDKTYEITSLKHSPKDFKYGEIKEEIIRGSKIRKFYIKIKNLIPRLMISNESIKYYASLVEFYSVYRLNIRDIKIVRLYIICFLFHRFHKYNDNMINALKYNLNLFEAEYKLYADEKILEYKIEGNEYVPKAGKILKIFLDKKIPESETFLKTKGRAFTLLRENLLAVVADYIENKASFDKSEFEWEYIEIINQKIKKNLRPIIMNIDFEFLSKNSKLIEALNILKNHISKKNLDKNNIFEFKENFIPKKFLKYIINDNKVSYDRCEYLIYMLICENLESGSIYCSDSVKYKSLASELVTNKEWENKDNFIHELGLKNFNKKPEKHLNELKEIYEKKLITVNNKIEKGENIYFEQNKTLKKSRWNVKTPSSSEDVNQYLFESLEQIDLIDVIYFAIKNANIMDCFEHILCRFTKEEADIKSITACIIAIATNMGIKKISDVSDLSYNNLYSSLKNFIRLETVKDACDKITNEIYKSPIFSKYHINSLAHFAGDGQKFEVKVSTINARHSPKYFGRKKGIVSYSMVGNILPTNSKIISANDHESHHVYDIISSNKSDVHPEVFSTDTHGTNDVNFAILYTFGYQFAPRYKDFYDVFTDSIGSFKNISDYSHLNLRPKKRFNTRIIIEEWENIQKIMILLA